MFAPLYSFSDQQQEDFNYSLLNEYGFLRHETNFFESSSSNDTLGEPEGISEKFLVVSRSISEFSGVQPSRMLQRNAFHFYIG